MKFKKIIALMLSVLMMFSVLTGCRKVNGDMSSGITSDTSSTVYDIVDVVDSEINDTQSTDDATSSENSVDSSDSTSSENNIDNIVSVGGDAENNTSSEESLPPTFIEEDEDNNSSNNSGTTDEGYSSGTFSTSPNENGKLVTVKIAPNSSVYYKIGRASNKVLTINSANAYVIYNGTKYEAKNGVLSFLVKSDELASAQIMFEIGNKGSKGESFTVLFTSELGTSDNPEEIKSIDNKFTTTVKKDNDQGYFYKYKASRKGKIRFYLLSDAKKCKLSVGQSLKNMNNVVAWGISDVIEEATYYLVSKDSTGVYIEFDVDNGDEFKICVTPLGDMGSNSSVTIDWKIVY